MSNVSTTAVNTSASISKTKGMTQVALFSALIILMAFTPFLGYIPLGFTRATIIHIPVIIGALVLGPKKGAMLGFVFGLTSFINNTMNPTPTSFVFTPFYNLGEYSGGLGSIIICFVPRILVGVVPFYVYHFVKKIEKKINSTATSFVLSQSQRVREYGGRIRRAINCFVNKILVKVFSFYVKHFVKESDKNKAVSSIGLVLAGISGAFINTLLVMSMIFIFFGKEYASANNITFNAVYGFILSIIGINGVPEAIVAGVLTLIIGKVLLNPKVRGKLGF